MRPLPQTPSGAAAGVAAGVAAAAEASRVSADAEATAAAAVRSAESWARDVQQGSVTSPVNVAPPLTPPVTPPTSPVAGEAAHVRSAEQARGGEGGGCRGGGAVRAGIDHLLEGQSRKGQYRARMEMPKSADSDVSGISGISRADTVSWSGGARGMAGFDLPGAAGATHIPSLDSKAFSVADEPGHESALGVGVSAVKYVGGGGAGSSCSMSNISSRPSSVCDSNSNSDGSPRDASDVTITQTPPTVPKEPNSRGAAKRGPHAAHGDGDVYLAPHSGRMTEEGGDKEGGGEGGWMGGGCDVVKQEVAHQMREEEVRKEVAVQWQQLQPLTKSGSLETLQLHGAVMYMDRGNAVDDSTHQYSDLDYSDSDKSMSHGCSMSSLLSAGEEESYSGVWETRLSHSPAGQAVPPNTPKATTSLAPVAHAPLLRYLVPHGEDAKWEQRGGGGRGRTSAHRRLDTGDTRNHSRTFSILAPQPYGGGGYAGTSVPAPVPAREHSMGSERKGPDGGGGCGGGGRLASMEMEAGFDKPTVNQEPKRGEKAEGEEEQGEGVEGEEEERGGGEAVKEEDALQYTEREREFITNDTGSVLLHGGHHAQGAHGSVSVEGGRGRKKGLRSEPPVQNVESPHMCIRTASGSGGAGRGGWGGGRHATGWTRPCNVPSAEGMSWERRYTWTQNPR